MPCAYLKTILPNALRQQKADNSSICIYTSLLIVAEVFDTVVSVLNKIPHRYTVSVYHSRCVFVLGVRDNAFAIRWISLP